jgi:hypothetical protein
MTPYILSDRSKLFNSPCLLRAGEIIFEEDAIPGLLTGIEQVIINQLHCSAMATFFVRNPFSDAAAAEDAGA